MSLLFGQDLGESLGSCFDEVVFKGQGVWTRSFELLCNIWNITLWAHIGVCNVSLLGKHCACYLCKLCWVRFVRPCLLERIVWVEFWRCLIATLRFLCGRLICWFWCWSRFMFLRRFFWCWRWLILSLSLNKFVGFNVVKDISLKDVPFGAWWFYLCWQYHVLTHPCTCCWCYFNTASVQHMF